jgi:hypothetical protein
VSILKIKSTVEASGFVQMVPTLKAPTDWERGKDLERWWIKQVAGVRGLGGKTEEYEYI